MTIFVRSFNLSKTFLNNTVFFPLLAGHSPPASEEVAKRIVHLRLLLHAFEHDVQAHGVGAQLAQAARLAHVARVASLRVD